MDFDGKPQSYGIIKAGEGSIINTFSTHRWLLKDKLYVTPEFSTRIKLHGKTGEESKPVEPVAEAATPEPPLAEAPDISFFKAAVDGDYEAIKTAIDSGIDVNAKGGFFGRTALSSVAHLGHMKIAELLISRGAEVDAKDSFRATPLHRASREGHKNISELLINKNANVAHLPCSRTLSKRVSALSALFRLMII